MSSRRPCIPSAAKEEKPGLLPPSLGWERFSYQVFHSAHLHLSVARRAVKQGCSSRLSLQHTTLPCPHYHQDRITGRRLVSQRLDPDLLCSNPGHSIYWLITLAKLLNFLFLFSSLIIMIPPSLGFCEN